MKITCKIKSNVVYLPCCLEATNKKLLEKLNSACLPAQSFGLFTLIKLMKKQDFTVFLYLVDEDGFDDDFIDIDIANNFIFWLKKGIRPIVGDLTSNENDYFEVTSINLHKGCIHITLKIGK